MGTNICEQSEECKKVSKVDKVNNKQNIQHLITPTSRYKAFVGMDDHEESEKEIFVDDLKESVYHKVKRK